jgi:TPR repeat protein
MRRRDDQQKVSLLMVEAQRGDARAQRLLALRYRRGRGVEQNDELASTWMKQAAMQGLSLAERDLGTFYRQGIGVAHDLQQAIQLYRLAAQQGDPIAKKFIQEMAEIMPSK